jgi:hypothetical protein
MDALLAEPLPQLPIDREVRRMRFAALIERRNAAARTFLETAKRAVTYKRAARVPPAHDLTPGMQYDLAEVQETTPR